MCEFLGHIGAQWLIFWEVAIAFSTEAEPEVIPTNSEGRPFPVTLLPAQPSVLFLWYTGYCHLDEI